jgi:hypothetical protein
LGLLIVLGAVGSGCYVTPVRREDHCRGGYWVEGHRGPRGRWHEAHWRCPGIIEIE